MSSFDHRELRIPIEDIKVGVSIQNIRTQVDDRSIKELADSIHLQGLMCPIVVMESENENGDPITELVAGERRLRAIQLVRNNRDSSFMEEIPCVQYEGTVHDAIFVNASENIDREQVDDVDISRWLFERAEEGITQSELAQRLHRSTQWVSFRVTFHARACAEVKMALREGLISFSAAYELSKNLSEEDQKKWIEKARRLNQKISVEAAKNASNEDKVKKPGKRARDKALSRCDKIADDKGSELARGAALTLRWVEGVLSTEDFDGMLEFEEQK